MQILGTIKGTSIVLDKNDKYAAYEVVDELPSTDDPRTAVILSSTEKMYVKIDGSWKEVTDTSDDDHVDAVNTIRCPMVENDVRLHWKDPDDKGNISWKYTRVVRKYGSYPTSIHDGVVVADSYVRNYYDRNYLHDFLPPGTEDKWFYKIWTITSDDVSYSSDGCQFQPIPVSWNSISNIIKSGNAQRIFAVGDIIDIDTDDADWGNVELEVIAFDNYISASVPHSVTLMTKNVMFDKVDWDRPWEEFKLTNDTIVLDPHKYYVRNVKPSGEVYYSPVTLVVGSVIEPGKYYEPLNGAFWERKTTGGNKYNDSLIRKWLTATNKVEGISVNPPSVAFASVENGSLMNVIKPSLVKTALPDIDGAGYSSTFDKFFLLSYTELTGENNVGTDGRSIQEGNEIRYLSLDVENRIRTLNDETHKWWTRSSILDSDHLVRAINTSGDIENNIEVFNDENSIGLVFAFIIA